MVDSDWINQYYTPKSSTESFALIKKRFRFLCLGYRLGYWLALLHPHLVYQKHQDDLLARPSDSTWPVGHVGRDAHMIHWGGQCRYLGLIIPRRNYRSARYILTNWPVRVVAH